MYNYSLALAHRVQHLKNQLNRGYNKLPKKKKSYKKLIKPFSSIKSSKNWTIVKYLYNSYPWVLIIILVNTREDEV
jgi:hypothetical protein